MNLEALTILCHDLPKSFDFESQSQPQFWHDVLARLRSIKATANGGFATHPHDRPIGVVPQIVLPEDFQPNRCGASLYISDMFYWDGTNEGYAYWNAVHAAMNPIYHKSRYGISAPRFHRQRKVEEPISRRDEDYLLSEFNLIPAFFREMDSYCAGHFPHHDPEDPTLLRYFPQTKPFHLDFAIRTKPGKFLEAFYGNVLSKPEIATLAAKFRVARLPPKLIIGTTADDFDHAYRNGPSSCMSEGKATFEGMYPPRSYAGGDLAIGYIEKETPSGKRVTARAVLFPERKIASRIYGDSEALGKSLRAEGYKICYDTSIESDYRAFDGATMLPQVAVDYEPMERSLIDEPVLVLPYGDHSQRGEFNRENGRLTWRRNYTGVEKHQFTGGFSIMAFPKDPNKLGYSGYPNGEFVNYYAGGSTGTVRQGLMRVTEYRPLNYLQRARDLWAQRQETQPHAM